MAQAQVLFTEDSLAYLKICGFESVNWCPLSKQVFCQLYENHFLTIKRKRKKTVVILQKGKSQLSLNLSQFKSLCD